MKMFRSSCVALICLLLMACGESEIDMVKNAPFYGDKSITYGKLFDTYTYIKNPKWEIIESDRGAKIVQVTADYDIISTFNHYTKDYQDKKFQTWLLNNYNFTLVAQFALSADGASFDASFLGLSINGETSSENINENYSYLLKNSYILYDYIKFIYEYEDILKRNQ